MNSLGSRSPLLKTYYPSLDGLRAVAILLVFWVHFGGALWPAEMFKWGFVGVDVFFVLSGFLITGILYDSLGRSDYFRNFYIRRSLRIFPLYYLMWFLLLCLTPFVHVMWTRYHVAMMFYIGNWFLPGGLLGLHANPNLLLFQHHPGKPPSVILLGHLWSLCVEEQFYLVWPAVIFLVRSRRKLLVLCVAVIALEPFARAAYLYGHSYRLHAQGAYSATWFRADTLLVGAVLALWMRGENTAMDNVRRWAWMLVVAPSVLLVVALKLEGPGRTTSVSYDPVINTIGFTLIALASLGLLLLTLDSGSSVARVLKHPVLTFLGRISYGMYLFHGPVAGYMVSKGEILHRHHIGFLAPLIAVFVTVGLAWLSFRFFESPFLALKSKLAPRSGAADEPPPYLEPQRSER